jgi:hypothetical protein
MKKKILTLILFISCSVIANAQLDLLKKATKGLKLNDKVPNLLENHPITTSLSDVRMDSILPETFTPRESKRSLITLQRTPNGGFVLQPGYYEFHDQSYCLKAGTHGPGGGEGYGYALTKGPAEDAVMSIVRNSVQHPEIEQRDVQVLLWAIIARSKFEDLQPALKLTASRLLTPRQLASLNRNAANFLPAPLMNQVKNGLPPFVQQVLEAENQLRGMLTSANSSYEQMERVAVLTGIAPMGEGSRQMPTGQWFLHPDNYYVRYMPSGYTNTVVEIWVPQGSPAVGKEYDPATHIAVPGNTARQRLIQSGRPYQN